MSFRKLSTSLLATTGLLFTSVPAFTNPLDAVIVETADTSTA